MRLTPQQTEAFERDGYLFFPSQFTPAEIQVQCLPDDCLLADYPVTLPWRDGTPEPALKSALAA